MADAVLDLKKARVLLSNDDGITAPGLKVLEDAIRPHVRELWVCAPETEQSATSHSLTLRRPLRIRHVSERKYAIDGTPTDAVLLGVSRIMADARPDLVISGINRGGNLGEDVTYSGTVAAAMEGALLGIPSVALSQVYEDRHKVKWATGAKWTPKVLKQLLVAGWPKGIFININFPDVTLTIPPGASSGKRLRVKGHGVDPRGDEYFWIGPQRDEERFLKGTDLAAVNSGAISVTPLAMDLTHVQTLRKLKDAVS